MDIDAINRWLKESGTTVVQLATALRMRSPKVKAYLNGEYPWICGARTKKRLSELSGGALKFTDYENKSGPERLVAWMAHYGMTQSKLASLIGISPSTISLVVRFKNCASKRVCRKICKLTSNQVRFEDLYSLDDEEE